MNDRRRQHLVTRPDGSLFDENAMASYLADLDRRSRRVAVTRLSELDPAFARQSRRTVA